MDSFFPRLSWEVFKFLEASVVVLVGVYVMAAVFSGNWIAIPRGFVFLVRFAFGL